MSSMSTTMKSNASKNHRWRFLAALCLVSLGWAISAPAQQPAVPDTIRIGSMPWVGWAALDVAEDQGIWQDLGLEVKVVHYDNSYLMHDAMFIGELDLALAMLGQIIHVHHEMKPVVVLGQTNWSHGGDVLMVQPDFNIIAAPLHTPLGIYVDGAALPYFLDLALTRAGAFLENFRLVVVREDEMVSQFKAGRIKAGVFFGPYALDVAAAGGEALATSADFPGCIPEGMYAFRDHYQSFDHGQLVNINRGWIQAVAWLNDPANQREFYRILRERTLQGMGTFSDADLKTMLEAVRPHDPAALKELNSPDGATAEYLLHIQNPAYCHHETVNLTNILDTRPLMDALAAEAGE